MAEIKEKAAQAEVIKWFGPVLTALRQLDGSGKPKEVEDIVAKNENVSSEVLSASLKNGNLRFSNQVAWARQYLVWEGLIKNDVYGLWELSADGYETYLDEVEARKIFLKWVGIHQKKNKLREIENEKDELPDDIIEPFNPKDIDITVETRSLDSIINRIKHGEIDLNTYFQRKGDLWSDSNMSRLIESILIRFPLPAFYFDATDDDNWLIVDGLQRLSAIKKFVLNTDADFVKGNYDDDDIEHNRHKPLKLTGLEYLSDYNGKIYSDLPANMQRRIKEAQITTYLVKPGTPEDVVYSVFYRINTGGLMLNAQEIRHALNQHGKGPKYLELLSDSEIFSKTVKISDKRMQNRELALRYLAFRLYEYKQYKPSMVRFLNKVMKEINYISNDKLQILKDDLERSLKICNQLFGDNAFSKSIAFSDYKSTLNRALFEIWTVTLSNLSAIQIDNLTKNKQKIVNEFKDLILDSDFDKSISISTTGHPQVLYRFERIEELVNKYTA